MFYEQVQSLCDKKGISISKLALDLKISKSNVTNWKNGSTPRADKLGKVAAYFDVSTDYLLGNKERPSAEAESLSPEAIELSKRIDQLSPANRAKLDELIDLYLSSQGKKK